MTLNRSIRSPRIEVPRSPDTARGRVQRWRRLGRLRLPDGKPLTGAMLPTPCRRSYDRWLLYYGALDSNSVSRVACLEVDLTQPTQAQPFAQGPCLDLGLPGHFDDNGVIPSAVVAVGSEHRLFYVGFQKQTKIPYTMLTGLATSRNGGLTFTRVLTTPVLERSSSEPFFRCAPWLLPTASGWRMWYIGGGTWLPEADRLLPSYSMRTMESGDERSWAQGGHVCLAPNGDEIGFGRPCVLLEGGVFRMWYSIRRRQGYRLGYAESKDGISWQRQDEALDLGPTEIGFDDEMACYPAVVRHGSNLLLFYNGNGYGRSGIGVAVLERD